MSNQGMFTMKITWKQAQIVESAIKDQLTELCSAYRTESTPDAKYEISARISENREILSTCFG